MTDAVDCKDVALAFLLDEQNKTQREQELRETVQAMKAENAKLRAANKVERVVKVEQGVEKGHNPNPYYGLSLDPPGTLTPREFLTAALNAGKRKNDYGVFYTNPKEIRDDMVKAISAFIGYDMAGNFGAQELAARTVANNLLTNKKIMPGSKEEDYQINNARRALPDATAPKAFLKEATNLRAREVMSIDEMLSHSMAALNPENNRRVLSQGLSAVEAERAKAIQDEMALLQVNALNGIK